MRVWIVKAFSGPIWAVYATQELAEAELERLDADRSYYGFRRFYIRDFGVQGSQE